MCCLCVLRALACAGSGRLLNVRCCLVSVCCSARACPVCSQLVEIMPCLDKLPQLLGRPYGLEDEEAAQQDGAEDMDADGPGAGPGSRQQQGGLALEELLQRVQVSWAQMT